MRKRRYGSCWKDCGERVRSLSYAERRDPSYNLYFKWSKKFLEAGKQRLVENTQLQADSQDTVGMWSEIEQLKLVVAEPRSKNRSSKTSFDLTRQAVIKHFMPCLSTSPRMK